MELNEVLPPALYRSDWIWWKHGVIYHIYPRSFYDSNGDGIGDLQGIIQKLDYIKDLGVSAIWLSPIYRSTHYDFGYDVSHYRKIDPVFGSLEDFQTFLKEAHHRGIHVIMDLVLNHTSDQHDWFLESRSAVDHPKRDWYIWKKGKGIRPPNNWKSVFGGSGWTYDPQTREYYYHSFLPQQPDLNWRNSELKEVLFADIKYWLDMGVDGFRLDVINLIGKDKKFRDNPNWFQRQLKNEKHFSRNRKRSLKITKQLRMLLDSYPEEKVVIGEIFAPPPGDSKLAASYIGKQDDNLNLTFDFSLIFSRWSARGYYLSIRKWYKTLPKEGWPCNVLSNHDLLRSYNRFKFRRNKLAKAKIEALLLLTLKGTPFVYYGEEIGQANHQLKRKELQDPLGKKYWPFFSGRDPARTPMQWGTGPHAGFSSVAPWLPANLSNAKKDGANVAEQTQAQYSLLNLYRRLIQLRKKHKALSAGTWTAIQKGGNGIIAYWRVTEEESFLVVLNFRRSVKKVQLPAGEFELKFSINKPSLKQKLYQSAFEIEAFGGIILKASAPKK